MSTTENSLVPLEEELKEEVSELQVTFNPPLYLERRGWVFSVMRKEKVKEVLDVGCGSGELVCCLCNPAPWIEVPPNCTCDDIQDEENASRIEFVIPEPDDNIHARSVHALDISRSDLKYAVSGTRPKEPSSYSVWDPVRWEELEVNLWEGGLESFNEAFVGLSVRIEHLSPESLPNFAPMLLGVYHPRLFLITTPSYTFNARFTPPDAPSSARQGFLDPTGRTNRIFRHDDHKFEWTVEEFKEYCEEVAQEWGYEVEVGGVGKAVEIDEWGRDDALGFASQTAMFRRLEGDGYSAERERKSGEYLQRAKARKGHQLLATHFHPTHSKAKKPESTEKIGIRVKGLMKKYREEVMTLRELWFETEISVACGGRVELLGVSVKNHAELELRKIEDIWQVKWLSYKPEAKKKTPGQTAQALGKVWKPPAQHFEQTDWGDVENAKLWSGQGGWGPQEY